MLKVAGIKQKGFSATRMHLAILAQLCTIENLALELQCRLQVSACFCEVFCKKRKEKESTKFRQPLLISKVHNYMFIYKRTANAFHYYN